MIIRKRKGRFKSLLKKTYTMKKLLFALVLLNWLALESCTKTANIEKEYILVEVLSDPGDGSGVFQAVTSDKKLIIYDDDTFKIENGKFCSFEEGAGLTGSGTINYSEGLMTGDECKDRRHLITQEGEYFTISYPCIEPCAQKYKEI